MTKLTKVELLQINNRLANENARLTAELEALKINLQATRASIPPTRIQPGYGHGTRV